jgi:purine-nucleoside phosphorylase
MSTVPEAIVARHCGMDVLGLSCVTNLGAGLSEIAPNAEEVLAVANRVGGTFTKLLTEIVGMV